MIVLVAALTALCGHPGMAHDVPGLENDPPTHFVGRAWSFLNLNSPVLYIGHAGDVSATHLGNKATGCGGGVLITTDTGGGSWRLSTGFTMNGGTGSASIGWG